jgi:hypothetical protein
MDHIEKVRLSSSTIEKPSEANFQGMSDEAS